MSVKKRSLNQLNAERFFQKHKLYKNPIDDTEKTSKCIRRVLVTMYLSIAAIYQQNPLEGIRRQHLNPMLMNYNADVGGVVLSYENLSLVDENTYNNEQYNESTTKSLKLSPHTPFIFCWCNVFLIIWAPQVGDIIEGWIFIQSASHIGLLIHDAFNASINKKNIPSDWTFIHSDENSSVISEGTETSNLKNRSLGYWVDGDGMQLGLKLKFVVKNLYTAVKMVSLEGTLLDEVSTARSRVENLPIVSNTKIVFDDEVCQENKDSHKDLKLSVITEQNGDEILYEKDSSDSSLSKSN